VIDWRLAVLLAVVVGTLGLVMALDPIAQDPAYHDFADRREIGGVPNFFDVVSNLPFLVIGIAGAWACRRLEAGAVRRAWTVLFAGVALVSVGSGYYHSDPRNETLMWDRLPMTIGFMGLFTALLGERFGSRVAAVALPVAVAVGIGSVLTWRWSGDLRLYAWVQFMPLLAIPVMVFAWKTAPRSRTLLLVALGWYGLAKVAEAYDAAVFQATGGAISGHTIKHLLAAVACGVLAAIPVTVQPPRT
jgi:hypothetical protein